MQIAVTEQGSSIDKQNRESRAMAPVETVERWFLLKLSSDGSCSNEIMQDCGAIVPVEKKSSSDTRFGIRNRRNQIRSSRGFLA